MHTTYVIIIPELVKIMNKIYLTLEPQFKVAYIFKNIKAGLNHQSVWKHPQSQEG